MWQVNFAAGLRTKASPAPTCLQGLGGQAVERRFKVYRNNVYSSLADNLAEGYPVVKQLVGDEFFSGMAHEYAKGYLPTSPVMSLYGEALGDFIDDFPPAKSAPYLGDVARLEYAQRLALHATDAEILLASAFERIPVESLLAKGLVLHPSVQIIRSRFPIYAIWVHATETDKNSIINQPESVLVSRPNLKVRTLRLSDGAAYFLSLIKSGCSLSDAADHALASGYEASLDEFIRIALTHACAIRPALPKGELP